MRLVCALYGDGYPFDMLKAVNTVTVTESPADLKAGDILVVWGGGDIHPSLYNKGRSSRSGAGADPSRRDRVEWALMKRAKELGVPIIGVCRGAQMLCALEGGYLIQHVPNHSGRHLIQLKDADSVLTNSIHHQMMVPKGNYELIGWLNEPIGHQYWDVTEDGKDLVDDTISVEPEFVYYPDSKGFAIQWHPEMMEEKSPANQFVLNFINNHV